MRITGHTVDLTADFLKILIFIGKIFKLCRAYKRKIRWIKKEHTPFPQYILLRNLLKVVVHVCLHFKIHNFLVD